jgi:hypothetical protein
MYRFRQLLNVFAGILQGAKHTAIRRGIGIWKARDQDITKVTPAF